MALTYVMITPAHNEEISIEKTIQSVIAQTILPEKWVIVSDGSTDHTDEIVKRYTKNNKFIEFIRLLESRERHFAAKVEAFNAGYQRVRNIKYDIIGNLDADVSFGEDFCEYLLDKFEQNPDLGVAGTDYTEGAFHSYRNSYISANHVNGQCQLFRRQCFEEIGGYIPIKYGGIDWVAVTTARMKGWTTRSFSERTFEHHRKMGTAEGNVLKSRFHYGRKDYFLGGHPIWELFRVTFQIAQKPYIIGGVLLFFGYFWSWLSRLERPITKELIEFHRQEQMLRLRQLILKGLRLNR